LVSIYRPLKLINTSSQLILVIEDNIKGQLKNKCGLADKRTSKKRSVLNFLDSKKAALVKNNFNISEKENMIEAK
jgi:hypothetical protein